MDYSPQLPGPADFVAPHRGFLVWGVKGHSRPACVLGVELHRPRGGRARHYRQRDLAGYCWLCQPPRAVGSGHVVAAAQQVNANRAFP